MSEARFERIARELRAAAPPAPEELRERVRGLPEPQASRRFRLRPALALAVAIAIAVGVGAAAIGGLRDRSPESLGSELPGVLAGGERASPYRVPPSGPDGNSAQADSLRALSPTAKFPSGTSALTPGSRLQDYNVSMRTRVEDLSAATKSAVRTTRRLGGYVAAADYATEPSAGDSRLDLRVPVQNVQRAIGSFTELGTILSQHISVTDLQANVDRLEQRIAAARKVIAELERKSVRTPEEQARLDAARRTVQRLSRGRTRLANQGAYAKISLALTTQKPAAKHTAPGRFDRFWGDAGDILGKEAIIVLYALVIAGPFVLLAALALLGERTRRRRADARLLEETG